MNQGQVHEINISHDWGNPNSYESEHGYYITVRICNVCGTEQSVLDLDMTRRARNSNESVSETPADQNYTAESIREIVKTASESAQMLERMNDQTFGESLFTDIYDFVDHLKAKYEHAVSEHDITFETAGHFLRVIRRSKKNRRKVLLALKQGLVCNRCDRFFFSIRQLTEDHIVPKEHGGQANLLNLQLLCRPCNEFKKADEPSNKDVSPYAYSGGPCKHQFTCKEIDVLRNAAAATSK